MIVSPVRHLDVFDPAAFDKRIDVIGAGATGSKVALELAKLGIRNIHVWDFDKVEKHNIANQAFRMADIGKEKVEALKDIVEQATGIKIVTHTEEATGEQEFGEVVFLLTDSIESRRKIFEGSLKYKVTTQVIIETRMGAEHGRVYTLDPNKPSHIKAWEATLKPVKKKVTACGTAVTVGATASLIASMAVWQMIRWFGVQLGEDDELENEIIFGLKPMIAIARKFE